MIQSELKEILNHACQFHAIVPESFHFSEIDDRLIVTLANDAYLPDVSLFQRLEDFANVKGFRTDTLSITSFGVM